MRWQPPLLALGALFCASVAATAALSVQFDPRTGCFSCSDEEYGTVLDGASVRLRSRAFDLSTGHAGLSFHQETRKTADGTALTVSWTEAGKRAWVRFELPTTGRVVTVRAATIEAGAGPDSPPIEAVLENARVRLGAEPVIGLLKTGAAKDRHVLTMTLGPADLPRARALFDRERDLALTLEGFKDSARFEHPLGADPASYRVVARAPAGEMLLRLALRPHYYRDELGLRYYAPISKRSYWRTAPVVAMTWYASHVQTPENLFPQVDWVAAHLLPYAGRHVFQLDDNYAIHDDAGMKAIADYIRSKGLIPGLWFTPFTVAPPENYQAHPDWFLHQPNGEALRGFGGISYGFLGEGQNYVLDARNPEAASRWFGAWWTKLSRDWGFDFFKIDGQPWAADVYRQAAGEPGVEAYRAALARGREIIGPDKFINGCWGIPLEAIGRVNGSRTGGDTGGQAHAMDVIIGWNFLNNIAWWCDPDAAANLYSAPVERVRLNTQARALTGQQLLTDDTWTKVPDAIAYVWQRAMPSVDAKPANLYRIENWGEYDVFDLKVEKPWGRWDVVGVFNYGALPKTAPLDLGALGLESGTYHLYDFWQARYLGRKQSAAAVPVALGPYEGKLFSLHRETDDPVVLSTSRHLTQGGADLLEYEAHTDGTRATAAGLSDLLVKGEPYVLTLAAGSKRATSARVDNGSITWSAAAGVSRLVITPARSGRARWSATFARPEGPVLEGEATVSGAASGAPDVGALRLENPGTRAVTWRAASDQPWLRVEPARGVLAPAATAAPRLLLQGQPLPYDTHAQARVTISTDPPAPGTPLQLPVEFDTGYPPNLALTATATASSVWGPEYEARMANDGNSMTRWNSRQGENDNAWLALTWPQPVRFDRVVVDETQEWGLRIQQWVLEARDGGQWRELATGTTMGPGHRIELPVTTARELRLRVPKASVTPTINELEVYLFARD